jgi:hypothetical protein
MRRIVDAALGRIIDTLPAEQFIALQFFKYHRRFPRIKNPRTFSEKIQHRKLYEANPRFHECADKVRVKEHVRSALGAQFVIPSLWSGKKLPSVEERNWPIPFIIKANHGCSFNILVRTESDKDWKIIDNKFEQWLQSRLPENYYESWYNEIEPQILVEPLLGDPLGSLTDYKFFVFGGRAEFVQVHTNRWTCHKNVFYDRNWTRQPFSLEYPLETRKIDRPRHFTEMLDAAEKLGNEFSFVRVDLYDLDSGPKFGELTFAPLSGLGRFRPVAYDRIFGNLWT